MGIPSETESGITRGKTIELLTAEADFSGRKTNG